MKEAHDRDMQMYVDKLEKVNKEKAQIQEQSFAVIAKLTENNDDIAQQMTD